jgi:hypothetical protein
VKNCSHLSDTQLPLFIIKFFDEGADVIAASPHPPTFRNTWGDGLFLVFDRVIDCAALSPVSSSLRPWRSNPDMASCVNTSYHAD